MRNYLSTIVVIAFVITGVLKVEAAGKRQGKRGLVQGENQIECDDVDGCSWGKLGSSYTEGLWVSHPNVYWRCNEPGMVALTYDDGPRLETTNILDLLQAEGVVATFFVNGIQITDITGPILTRAETEGHVIAHHTYDHLSIADQVERDGAGGLTAASLAFFEHQIDDTIAVASPFLPTKGLRPYLRPPYLALDADVATYLQERYEMYVVQINVDTKDFENGSTQTSIENAFIDNLYDDSTKHSWVALQHDNYAKTTGAISAMIAYGKSLGYRFVGIDECLGFPNEQASQPTTQPTTNPSTKPTNSPSVQPSVRPSVRPSVQPTENPTGSPSKTPSSTPTSTPSTQPTTQPSFTPSATPTQTPTKQPSHGPSASPSTLAPTKLDDTQSPSTAIPTATNTTELSPKTPTRLPTLTPSIFPVDSTIPPSSTQTSYYRLTFAGTFRASLHGTNQYKLDVEDLIAESLKVSPVSRVSAKIAAGSIIVDFSVSPESGSDKSYFADLDEMREDLNASFSGDMAIKLQVGALQSLLHMASPTVNSGSAELFSAALILGSILGCAALLSFGIVIFRKPLHRDASHQMSNDVNDDLPQQQNIIGRLFASEVGELKLRGTSTLPRWRNDKSAHSFTGKPPNTMKRSARSFKFSRETVEEVNTEVSSS